MYRSHHKSDQNDPNGICFARGDKTRRISLQAYAGAYIFLRAQNVAIYSIFNMGVCRSQSHSSLFGPKLIQRTELHCITLPHKLDVTYLMNQSLSEAIEFTAHDRLIQNELRRIKYFDASYRQHSPIRHMAYLKLLCNRFSFEKNCFWARNRPRHAVLEYISRASHWWNSGSRFFIASEDAGNTMHLLGDNQLAKNSKSARAALLANYHCKWTWLKCTR